MTEKVAAVVSFAQNKVSQNKVNVLQPSRTLKRRVAPRSASVFTCCGEAVVGAKYRQQEGHSHQSGHRALLWLLRLCVAEDARDVGSLF